MLSISQGDQSYYSCTSCSKLYEDYNNQKKEESHQNMIYEVNLLILNYKKEKPITKVKTSRIIKKKKGYRKPLPVTFGDAIDIKTMILKTTLIYQLTEPHP